MVTQEELQNRALNVSVQQARERLASADPNIDFLNENRIDNLLLRRQFKDRVSELMAPAFKLTLVFLGIAGLMLSVLAGKYIYIIWSDPEAIIKVLKLVVFNIFSFAFGAVVTIFFRTEK